MPIIQPNNLMKSNAPTPPQQSTHHYPHTQPTWYKNISCFKTDASDLLIIPERPMTRVFVNAGGTLSIQQGEGFDDPTTITLTKEEADSVARVLWSAVIDPSFRWIPDGDDDGEEAEAEAVEQVLPDARPVKAGTSAAPVERELLALEDKKPDPPPVAGKKA